MTEKIYLSGGAYALIERTDGKIHLIDLIYPGGSWSEDGFQPIEWFDSIKEMKEYIKKA